MRSIILAAAAVLVGCDAVAEGEVDTGTGTGDGGNGCPTLCDGACPPECVPSPCWTVGDGCSLALGDQQCGERMACRLLEGSGSASGVCVAPCSADSPCAVGKCDLKAGACMDDGVPVPPVACD